MPLNFGLYILLGLKWEFYKFPKESGKILDFLDDLESLGIIKILDNKLFTYKKTKLNTNKDTALKVNKFLGI